MTLVLYFFQQIPSPSFCKIQFNDNETSLEFLIFLKLSPPDLSEVWLLLLLLFCFSYVSLSLMLLECVKNEILGGHMEAGCQHTARQSGPDEELGSLLRFCPQKVCSSTSWGGNVLYTKAVHSVEEKPTPGETRKSAGFWKAPKIKCMEDWR